MKYIPFFQCSQSGLILVRAVLFVTVERDYGQEPAPCTDNAQAMNMELLPNNVKSVISIPVPMDGLIGRILEDALSHAETEQ